MTARQRYTATRVAYVGVVLLATLTNLEFSGDIAEASRRLARAFAPSLGWGDAIDGLRNLALFAGLGAVWVVTSISGKVRREIWMATLAGCAVSVTVEGLQVFSPVRIASIVDVTTNTLGALGGAIATAFLLLTVRRAKDEKSYAGVPTIAIAGPYALALLCEALTPLFHSEPLKGLEGSPLTRLRIALEFALPLSLSEVQLCDIPLYAVGGFLLVMLLREGGQDSRRSAWTVGVAGGVVVVAAHVLHGMSGLQVRWEAAVTDVISLGIGAWAARRWLAPLTMMLRGSARARATIFAYIALLVLWGWRPLLPQLDGGVILGQFTASQLVPLRSLADRVDVFSAMHVGQQFLLYMPLGALLAVWPLRLEGRWSHLWPGIWLAFVIEMAHPLFVNRTLDSTNALLGFAGVCIGWVVMRRCGFKTYGAALE